MKKKIIYDEQTIFRFHYLHFGTIGKLYGMNVKELHDWKYTPFIIPKNFSVNDAFQLLSYLIQKVEHDLDDWDCSPKSISVLNDNLKKFGFTTLPNYTGKTVDLYTVTGSMWRFRRSEFYKEYFEWFNANVWFEQIRFICRRNGMEFENPIFTLE